MTSAIPAIPTNPPLEQTGTPTPTLAAESASLNQIASEIGRIEVDLNHLDQTGLPATLNPVTSDTVPARPATRSVLTGGQIAGDFKVLDPGSTAGLSLITDPNEMIAAADRLRKEVDQLEQKLSQLDIASQSDLAPGYSSVIEGEAAQQLAAQTDAPHGWPVQGPVSSPFGLRTALFIPGATIQHSVNVIESKGGNPLTPAPSATSPLSATIAVSGTIAPQTSPVPTNTMPQITPIMRPTSPVISPTGQAITPTPATSPASPTGTPTRTACVASTPAPLTPGSNRLQVRDSADCPAPSVPATPTPTATVNPPGPGYDSTGLLIPAGMEFHSGIDIAVPEGTEVHATAGGVVEYAGDGRGGYGNVVYINHPGGFITIYGHNSRLLVKAGQTVTAGQTIALAGSTGYSTGPHVHYEVRYGSRLCDPAPFLPYK